MYNKNHLGRASLTSEYEDGVKTFIEWAKGQRGHMDGDKIRCPSQKCKNTKFRTPDRVSYHLCMRGFMPEYYNWTSHCEESVPEYFEAATVPPASEEQTPAVHVEGNYPHWGDEQHMDWAQRMVFDTAGTSYFSSSHDGVPDDGMSPALLMPWGDKILPAGYTLPGDYYNTNKLIKDLDLPVEKIGTSDLRALKGPVSGGSRDRPGKEAQRKQ
ncbi:UNVERIFIED_CONTAM: hypothetical protein Slati_3924700 [Sesamum latifolium]|uniref:Transposase-associated domain-containing protein n=1 Tax=Sesamum latifolium TaxID=2727402 RepID=A0AAW2TMC3_9LAMI